MSKLFLRKSIFRKGNNKSAFKSYQCLSIVYFCRKNILPVIHKYPPVAKITVTISIKSQDRHGKHTFYVVKSSLNKYKIYCVWFAITIFSWVRVLLNASMLFAPNDAVTVSTSRGYLPKLIRQTLISWVKRCSLKCHSIHSESSYPTPFSPWSFDCL